MKKPNLRQVEDITKGHTTSEWWSWGSNLSDWQAGQLLAQEEPV